MKQQHLFTGFVTLIILLGFIVDSNTYHIEKKGISGRQYRKSFTARGKRDEYLVWYPCHRCGG
jgi:hypothetical protein